MEMERTSARPSASWVFAQAYSKDKNYMINEYVQRVKNHPLDPAEIEKHREILEKVFLLSKNSIGPITFADFETYRQHAEAVQHIRSNCPSYNFRLSHFSSTEDVHSEVLQLLAEHPDAHFKTGQLFIPIENLGLNCSDFKRSVWTTRGDPLVVPVGSACIVLSPSRTTDLCCFITCIQGETQRTDFVIDGHFHPNVQPVNGLICFGESVHAASKAIESSRLCDLVDMAISILRTPCWDAPHWHCNLTWLISLIKSREGKRKNQFCSACRHRVVPLDLTDHVVSCLWPYLKRVIIREKESFLTRFLLKLEGTGEYCCTSCGGWCKTHGQFRLRNHLGENKSCLPETPCKGHFDEQKATESKEKGITKEGRKRLSEAANEQPRDPQGQFLPPPAADPPERGELLPNIAEFLPEVPEAPAETPVDRGEINDAVDVQVFETSFRPDEPDE